MRIYRKQRRLSGRLAGDAGDGTLSPAARSWANAMGTGIIVGALAGAVALPRPFLIGVGAFGVSWYLFSR